MTDPITRHTLRDGDTSVTVLSMGGAIQDWQTGGRRMVLGYTNPEDYRDNPHCMGFIIGRVANRIAGARFEMDGQVWPLIANEGPNQLHGGPGGLGWRNWDLTPEGDRAVRLRLHSPHLDQGFPGAVDFEVMIRLEDNALSWDMTARPDRKTPINMTQHVYFNLGGTDTIRDHRFRIAASHVTPTDAALIPTGALMRVDGTRFDLRTPRSLSEADPDGLSYDLNYALDDTAGPQVEVSAPDGTALRMWTTRPGLQLYTSGGLSAHGTPLPDQQHGRFAGFCLEGQDFPDALNQSGFADIFCTPEHPYHHRTTIQITRA